MSYPISFHLYCYISLNIKKHFKNIKNKIQFVSNYIFLNCTYIISKKILSKI